MNMQDIETTLASIDGLSDDAKKSIIDAVKENYRTIAEVNAKGEKIKQLENQNAEAQKVIDEMKAADGSNADEIARLQKQVEDYEAARDQAAKDAAEKQARDAFAQEFAQGIGEGKKFANSVVEDAIKEKAYAMRQRNADMPIADIVKAVVPDESGIWANPQTDPKKMPQCMSGSDMSGITSLEQVEHMSTDEINKNWDAIEKLLAQQ